MLKKKPLSIMLSIFAASSINIITASAGTLTVKPDDTDWGYIGARVTINNVQHIAIKSGVQIPIAKNDEIELEVIAMNVKPRIENKCQHLKIKDNSDHELLFKLEPDWLIHCYYA